MHILITGGTGLVGSHLVPALLADGHRVTVMVRKAGPASTLPNLSYVVYETNSNIPASVGVVDGIINLAGVGIADQRWTPEYKQQILKSRVDVTMACVRYIRQQSTSGSAPAVFVSASAVGIYGTAYTRPVTEQDAPGNDFLALVGKRWEAAAADAGIRTVITRFGVILANNGGAFPKLLAPFKFYAGGYIGDGKQGFPWVHIDDVVGMIRHALTHLEVTGVMNVTAPELHTNASFGRVVGKVLDKPAGIPVPGFVVKAMMGESAMLVTEGQQALPTVAQATGYSFVYSTAEAAVRNLVAEQA